MRSILDILRGRAAKTGSGKAGANDFELSRERLSELKQLETRLGYSFRDPILLEAAFTHRSFVYEHQSGDSAASQVPKDYECLEFLGDSVLGVVISEYLFLTFPAHPEGELSKMKSYLVSTNHLAKLSQTLGLGEFLLLSHGEEKTGGRNKKAILADLLESLTAAIYLDGGLDEARRFLLGQFEVSLARLEHHDLDFRDYKSRLQERLHQLGFAEPHYHVVGEQGPPHRREFRIEVRINERSLASGEGRSKKEAQQKAARLALQQIELPKLQESTDGAGLPPEDAPEGQ